MSKIVLLTATVQSHICQFHKPLVKMLHDNGYTVYVAAKNNLAEKNGLALDFVDKVYDVPFDRSPVSLKNIKAFKQLKKIISENDFDYIHTNTPAAGVFTRLAARKTRKNGTCVIYTAHGFHFYKGAPKKNWLIYYPIEKHFAKLTDKLITITNEDYETAMKKFNTNVFYIHGVGANTTKYFSVNENEKVEIRKELGISQDEYIILNVGELLPNKNQKTAILAMSEVVKTIQNAKLYIAGNGPELHNLTELVKSLKLENNVVFLGYTLELNKYYNISNCVVACSYREGLPMNVIEAMLCGNPVIASKNRGHQELISKDNNGFLVSPNDYFEFSDKIVHVLKNHDLFVKNIIIEKAKMYSDNNVYYELKHVYFATNHK